ncbi:lipase member H-like [Culicoides brevitarsis]|uniref:lipase member H-like n=1 Tax=Culicoides brevitarsis TaxID=469753 RepID=UPI00307C1374
MKRRIFSALFIFYSICVHCNGYTLYEIDEESGNKIFFIDAYELSDDPNANEEYGFDAKKDTKFLLYTSKNWDEPENIELCNEQSLLQSSFVPGNPVRVIIHGFRDGPNSIVSSVSRQGYRALGNFNVIVVDWSKGADTLNYMLAKDRIYRIGPVVAEFIECLLETFKDKVALSDFYLIGHSLGAHLAGIVGKNMKQGKIAAIYGLDPAAPLFSIDNPDKRLDKNDAEYVEIIHTDGGLQGMREPMGTADFYPNWGIKQPGCGMDLDGACSHQRSAYYFGESLTSEKGFWADLCESYDGIKKKNCTVVSEKRIKMGGEPGNKGKANGIYYLKTGKEKPFALGDN